MKSTRWQDKLLNYFAFLFFAFTLLNAMFAFAGPTRTTYQAKIIKPDGYPLEASNVNFKFTILDPSGSCIIFAETYSSVNMSSTGGLISFSLGSGVKTFPVSGTTFEQIFSNITPNIACDTGGAPAVYTPLANDARKIVMQFHDGGGWQTLPAMNINAVPYAMYANDAQKFNGMTPSEFVQVATIPTCTASEALRYTGSAFQCVITAGGGSVSSGSVITALGYTPADSASVSTVSSTVFSVATTVSSFQSSVAASFAALVNSQWLTSGTAISYNAGRVGVGTDNPVYNLHVLQPVSGSTQVTIDAYSGTPGLYFRKANGTVASPLAVSSTSSLLEIAAVGHGQTGFLSTSAAKILMTAEEDWTDATGAASIRFHTRGSSTTAPSLERMRIDKNGNVGIGVTAPITKLDVSGGVRLSMEAAACAVSYAGTLRYNSGFVEYCNGTAWAAFGTGGAVTSSSITAALSYTPANSTEVATSFTALTNSFNITGTSVTTLTSTVNNLSSSYTSLASAVSGISSSQWVSSGTAISYTNGNVGIGTSSPTKLFQVNWSPSASWEMQHEFDAASNGPALNSAYDLGASGEGRFNFVKARGTLANPTGVLNNDFLGTISFRGANASGTLVHAALIRAIAAQDFVNTSAGSHLVFQTSSSGSATPSEKVRIDSQGNVGIGTTSPNINSTSATVIHLHNSLGKAASMRFTNSGTGTTATDGVVIGKWNDDATYGNGPIFWNYESTPITFATSSTERMIISAVGNVGIGITSPTAALHIKAGTSSSASLRLTSGTLLTSPQSGTIEYDGVNFYTTNGAGVRTAIGSSAVSSTASLMDSGATFGSGHKTVMSGYDPNGLVWHIGVSGTQALDINARYSGSPITMTIGGSEMMRVMGSTGFVGIGTQTPTQKLDVHGYMRSASGSGGTPTDGGRLYFATNSSGPNYDLSYVGGYTDQAGNDGSGAGSRGGIVFATKSTTGASAATEKMRIDLNGLLGLGINAPLKGLHVVSGAMVGTTDGFPAEYASVHNEFNSGALKKWTETTGNHVNAGTYSLVSPASASTKASHSLVNILFVDVASGVTVTGTNNSFYNFASRNRYLSNSDNGHVNLMVGIRNEYGHEASVPGNSPTTGQLYGALFAPNARTGTISNLYDLYISPPTGGGTIGQHYSIYQAATSATNYFGGRVGFGTATPDGSLHVVTSSLQSNSPASGIFLGKSLGDDYQIQLTQNSGIPHIDFSRLAGRDYDARISSPANSTLSMGTASNSMLLNLYNGYVGIGTLTPTRALQIGTTAGWQDGSGILVKGSNPGLELADTQATPQRWLIANGVLVANDGNLGLAYNVNTSTHNIVVTSGGLVGIGTLTPDDKFMVYNGTSIGRYTTTGWTHVSDARYKHDIKTLDSSLQKILQLRGVEYKFNKDPENKNQLGFIAQEVEPIFPEVVVTDKKGFKSMVYANLVAPLVEAVKSLYVQLKENILETRQNSRQIASLQQENEKLKNENLQKAKELDDVKSRLERLEKILSSH